MSPTELDVTVQENTFLVMGRAHKAKGGSLTAKRAAAGAGFPMRYAKPSPEHHSRELVAAERDCANYVRTALFA
jgi:hypothetical protein